MREGGKMMVRAAHNGGRLIFALFAAALLAACDQGQSGMKGDPGPPGPPGPRGEAGPPGPSGSASGVRVVRSPCNETGCSAQCNDDEVLLTAYCGAAHNPPVFPTDRSAICRARGPANHPLVIACVKAPAQ